MTAQLDNTRVRLTSSCGQKFDFYCDLRVEPPYTEVIDYPEGTINGLTYPARIEISRARVGFWPLLIESTIDGEFLDLGVKFRSAKVTKQTLLPDASISLSVREIGALTCA
jgi:hypothetical protein